MTGRPHRLPPNIAAHLAAILNGPRKARRGALEALTRDHPEHAVEIKRLVGLRKRTLVATRELPLWLEAELLDAVGPNEGDADRDVEHVEAVVEELCGSHPEHRKSIEAWYARFAWREDPHLGMRRIGQMFVMRKIGSGGMGVVHLAWDAKGRRPVALKLLPPSVLNDDVSRRRFIREVKSIVQVRHPSVLRVYEVGDHDGQPYFTMEFVRGTSLDHVIDRLKGRFRRDPSKLTGRDVATALARFAPVDRSLWDRDYTHFAADVVAQIAEALAEVHSHRIVHRDVKPSNVLLSVDGRAQIFDFGLARVEKERSLTVQGEFVGSPTYIAPEQLNADGAVIDGRADVYSLGVTLFELLALRPPFEAPTLEQLYHKVRAGDPPPITRLHTDLDRDLAAIVSTAMERDPRDRYASAAEMAADLRSFLQGSPVRAHSHRWRIRVLQQLRDSRTARWATVAALPLLGALTTFLVFAWQADAKQAELLAELRDVSQVESIGELDVWRGRAAHLSGNRAREAEQILDGRRDGAQLVAEVESVPEFHDLGELASWTARAQSTPPVYREQVRAILNEHRIALELIASIPAPVLRTPTDLDELDERAARLREPYCADARERIAALRPAVTGLAELRAITHAAEVAELESWGERAAHWPTLYQEHARPVLTEWLPQARSLAELRTYEEELDELGIEIARADFEWLTGAYFEQADRIFDERRDAARLLGQLRRRMLPVNTTDIREWTEQAHRMPRPYGAAILEELSKQPQH